MWLWQCTGVDRSGICSRRERSVIQRSFYILHLCLSPSEIKMILAFYQLGACKAREPAGPKIALLFPHLFVCLSVRPHLSRAQYYIMRYYATVVYYCTNRFWRFVGQDTEGKWRFVLPRWRKSGRHL